MISYLVKEDKEYQPEVIFDPHQMEVLENISQKELPTLKQAVQSLAKLVGFVPTKRQPMPCVKILAEALESFYYVKIGFKSAKNKMQPDKNTKRKKERKPLQD